MVTRGGRGGTSPLTLPGGCPLELHCRRVGVYGACVGSLVPVQTGAARRGNPRRGAEGLRGRGTGVVELPRLMGQGRSLLTFSRLTRKEGQTLSLTFYFERIEDSHVGVRTDTDSSRVPSSTLPPADLLHGCGAAPHLDAGVGTTHACADPSTRALRA